MLRKPQYPLTSFAAWLAAAAYSEHTVYTYCSVVRTVLRRLDAPEDAHDAEKLLGAVAHLEGHTRYLYATGWNAYRDFAQETAGIQLPGLTDADRTRRPAAGGQVGPALPPIVDAALLMLFRLGFQPHQLAALTWRCVGARPVGQPHLLLHPQRGALEVSRDAIFELAEWARRPDAAGPSTDQPLVPLVQGGDVVAKASTIRRAIERARRAERNGLAATRAASSPAAPTVADQAVADQVVADQAAAQAAAREAAEAKAAAQAAAQAALEAKMAAYEPLPPPPRAPCTGPSNAPAELKAQE